MEAVTGRRRGRRLPHKRPLRTKARRVEEDEPAQVGLHWYVIGLSIVLVAITSVVNVLTLPDEPDTPPQQQDGRFLGKQQPAAVPSQPISATLPDGGQPVADAYMAQPHPELVGIDTQGWRESRQAPPPSPPPRADPPPSPPPPRQPSAQAQEWQRLAERSASAASNLPPADSAATAVADQTLDVSKAAVKGAVATFEGDAWMFVEASPDADEITFGSWIFVPKVPDSHFPPSSTSMKTIASTKVSGCNVGGDPGSSDGWSLWVHEWGTTNRQLRLSWTSGGSACNELFSRTDLVPYDEWTLVGFTLSRSQNVARLFLSGRVVADTSRQLGEVAKAGKPQQWNQVDIASRAVSRREGVGRTVLSLGAHRHQPKDTSALQSHVFIGFIGDTRIIHAVKEPEVTARLLALSSEELLASGLVPASAVALQAQFQQGVEPENLVDSTAFSARRSDSNTDQKDAVRLLAFSERPRHPIFLLSGIVAGPPGPTLDPSALLETWPDEWTSAWTEEQLLQSQREADPWADEVRDAMRHTWAGYRLRAWGHDEVKPVSGGPKDWCKLAITMLDSLSTLWIMGLKEEFDDAEKWLQDNPLPSPGKHGMHSLFEINIRAVAGLLSAYSLSGRKIFLDTAVRLADKMLPAFRTPHGMPHSAVDVGTGEAGKHTWQTDKNANSVLAEVTTVQVEFRYLSHVTGNMAYQQVADKAENVVLHAAGGRGIVPLYLNNKIDKPTFVGNKISLGAMGDSYYEYLLKQWIQSGRKEDYFKEAWKLSMQEMISQLVMKTEGGLTFIAEKNGGNQAPRMDHLACFVSGMLMLGARTLPKAEVNPRWEPLAAEVAHTCHEMYRRSPTGLSPEYVSFKVRNTAGEDMAIPNDAPHNLLRPEAIEALYYLHYYTGDLKYRKWAYEMFSAFQKHCKARFGYSALGDVRKPSPLKRDSQESFWLAETLKYFYLIFSPRSTLSLEKFVLNTEAHPLKIWGQEDEEEEEEGKEYGA